MKLVLIKLATKYGEILERVIDEVEEEGMLVQREETLKYENQWEFQFKDPDEKFMFDLGRRYGKAISEKTA